MTQDFAKKRPSKESTRDSPSSATRVPSFSFATFVTGFLLGAFITFLISLYYLKPSEDILVSNGEKPRAEPQVKDDGMQWDFYEIFPKSVVPVVEEYTKTGEKVIVDDSRWILQAGSFKTAIDADERRATLILMGLDVSIREVKVEGASWHRIIVGPFDSLLERNRAENKLAQAEISSIPMKIPAS
ncbi:MAG: SPOR domain-containing protein [Pseudomonadales bacterium]|nr:SPOR domain-containing protein [Pseudomonadales bacterium]